MAAKLLAFVLGCALVVLPLGAVAALSQTKVSCEATNGAEAAAQTLKTISLDRVADTQRAFYVSPRGNDAWTGRRADPSPDGHDGPFATLARARDAAQADKSTRVIYLRGGHYELAAPVTFDEKESGLLIRAIPGEIPELSGAASVPTSNAVPDKLGRLRLPLAQDPGPELFMNGERLSLAAKPNDPPVVRDGWRIAAERAGTSTFLFGGDDIQLSDLTPLPRIEMIDPTRAFSARSKILSVDLTKREVHIAPIGHGEDIPVGTYRLLGHPEWVTQAGSFAWDGASGQLLVLPATQTAAPHTPPAVVRVPKIDSLIIIRDTSNIQIEGIRFVETRTGFADELENAAIVVENGKNIRIAGNSFRNVGKGVRLSATRLSQVVSNAIEQTGSSGIELQDGSDNNVVWGNKLSAAGQMDISSAAIWLHGAADNRVASNVIDGASRHGISIDNWDDSSINRRNIVEYNRVLHTSQVASDTGAIEMLGRSGVDTQSVIRFNDIEDAGGLSLDDQGQWQHGKLAAGIYLDDLTSGVLVCGNFIRGAGLAAIQIHGGFGITVRDNLALLDRPGGAFIFIQGATPVSGGERFSFLWQRRNLTTQAAASGGQAHDSHKLAIRFDNDAQVNGEDRDLYVTAVELNGHRLTPSDSNARYVTDDGRTMPGNTVLPTNGQLVWDLPAKTFEDSPDVLSITFTGWGVPAGGAGAHFVLSIDGGHVGDGYATEPVGFMAGNTISRNIIYATSPGKTYYKFLAAALPRVEGNDYVDTTGTREPTQGVVKDIAPLKIDPRFIAPARNDYRYRLSQQLIAAGFGELPSF